MSNVGQIWLARTVRERWGGLVEYSVSVLGPDYDQVSLMSTGGMGELFRAHKRGLDVDVVVKRVQAQYRGRINEAREANILKNLRHQFLPRI